MLATAMECIMAAVGDPIVAARASDTTMPQGSDVPIALALTCAVGALLGGLVTWWSRCHVERGLRRDVQRRDAHLARTSHELRTPLSAVLSALEIVRDGHAATEAERATFLEQAEQAAQHLLLLVDDVLDAAAIDAEQLRLQPEDLSLEALFATSSGALRMLAARHAGTVRFPEPPLPQRVHADARRTTQVLFNLVGNALRFAPSGTAVQVTVTVEADRARIEVRDRGPGVPPHVRSRLFEPFAGDQLAVAGAAGAGTGLGLHVARQLVEQMGGRIGYRPEQPGATFWFTLPLAHEAIVAPGSAPRA